MKYELYKALTDAESAVDSTVRQLRKLNFRDYGCADKLFSIYNQLLDVGLEISWVVKELEKGAEK